MKLRPLWSICMVAVGIVLSTAGCSPLSDLEIQAEATSTGPLETRARTGTVLPTTATSTSVDTQVAHVEATPSAHATPSRGMQAEESPLPKSSPTRAVSVQETHTLEEPPGMGRIFFVASEEDDVYRQNRWGGNSDIWLITDDALASRRWLADGLYKTQPIASPDSTQIAYVVNRTLEGQLEESVWIAELDGTNPRQVSPSYRTQDPELPEDMASLRVVYVDLFGWSADGRRLAYTVRGESWGEPHLLFVLDVLSGEVAQIEGADTLSAMWSPQDPDLLVMNQFTTPYLVNTATGHQERVGELEGQDIYSAWTPNGGSLFAIVVSRAIHPVEQEGIIIVDLSTRDSRWLDIEGAWGAWWSPSGQLIAYVSNVSDDKGAQEDSLLIADLETESMRVLVDQKDLNVYGLPLVWSLDSRWIVGFGYPTIQWQNATLYLIDIATGQMTEWATNLPGPIGESMIWCHETVCVNGGYHTR